MVTNIEGFGKRQPVCAKRSFGKGHCIPAAFDRVPLANVYCGSFILTKLVRKASFFVKNMWK